MLTEEKIEKNYGLFLKALSQIGISDLVIKEETAELIKHASFSLSNGENGNVAYDGSLIETILRVLTPYAVKINDALPKDLQVEKEKVIKVCLLSHLSKMVMFVKNDNQWEIEKRGMVYKYAPTKVALKMGMKSLYIAQSLGIKFTEDEMEAMTVMDRDENDSQVKYYSSPLATIIKQANELTHLTNRLHKNEEE